MDIRCLFNIIVCDELSGYYKQKSLSKTVAGSVHI